jgi:hypothetical protein
VCRSAGLVPGDEVAVEARADGLLLRPAPQAEEGTPTERPDQPIWERIAGRAESAPPEERAKLPTDLSRQVDHYAYGLPKRPE